MMPKGCRRTVAREGKNRSGKGKPEEVLSFFGCGRWRCTIPCGTCRPEVYLQIPDFKIIRRATKRVCMFEVIICEFAQVHSSYIHMQNTFSPFVRHTRQTITFVAPPPRNSTSNSASPKDIKAPWRASGTIFCVILHSPVFVTLHT